MDREKETNYAADMEGRERGRREGEIDVMPSQCCCSSN